MVMKKTVRSLKSRHAKFKRDRLIWTMLCMSYRNFEHIGIGSSFMGKDTGGYTENIRQGVDLKHEILFEVTRISTGPQRMTLTRLLRRSDSSHCMLFVEAAIWPFYRVSSFTVLVYRKYIVGHLQCIIKSPQLALYTTWMLNVIIVINYCHLYFIF